MDSSRHRSALDEGGFAFEAEIWQSASTESWAFVTLPAEVDEEVRELAADAGPRRGFGSVRVEVRIGTTTWRTSVFPDRTRGYVLPVKQAVRRAESLDVGDSAQLHLVVL